MCAGGYRVRQLYAVTTRERGSVTRTGGLLWDEVLDLVRTLRRFRRRGGRVSVERDYRGSRVHGSMLYRRALRVCGPAGR